MAYTVEIESTDKTSLIKSLNFSRLANHDDTLTCTLVTTAAVYLPLEGQDIQVYDGIDFVYGGVIDTLSIEKIEGGYGNDKKVLVTINSGGYKQICRRRTTTSTYQNSSAKVIIESIIDNILSQEGITKGSISTGVSTYGEDGIFNPVTRNCAEIFDELAIASGYVWFIDGNKSFNFYDFDTIIDIPNQITEGGAFTDFAIESYTKDMSQYANKVFVTGGVGDDGYVVTTYQQDNAEIAARIAIEGGSGVYGYVLVDENITLLADATTAATNYLTKSSIVPQTLVFTTFTMSQFWYPGLRLTVNLPTLGIATNTYFMIESVSIGDVDGKNLQATITATSRRSDDFSTQQAQTGIEYLSKVVANSKNGNATSYATDTGTGNIYPVIPGVVQVWVETVFPPVAKNKDVLVDTNDPSRYDQKDVSTTNVLVVADHEYIRATGLSSYSITLHSATVKGTIKYIKNLSTVLITIIGTIDGDTNAYLYPKEYGLYICNGTDWDKIG